VSPRTGGVTKMMTDPAATATSAPAAAGRTVVGR
jgi:hypothetical protein